MLGNVTFPQPQHRKNFGDDVFLSFLTRSSNQSLALQYGHTYVGPPMSW